MTRPLVLLLTLLLCLTSCGDNEIGSPDLTALPYACFDMQASWTTSYCYTVAFLLSPGCAVGPGERWHELEYRWDYDGDGFWDTEFEAYAPLFYYTPSVMPSGTWAVRLQTRNEDGVIREAANELRLNLPSEPDVVLREAALIDPETELELEELAVGQRFSLILHESCWNVETPPEVRLDLYINQVLTDSTRVICSLPRAMQRGTATRCLGQSGGEYQIDTPGEYEIFVRLNGDNAFEETKTTNNGAFIQINVVEAP